MTYKNKEEAVAAKDLLHDMLVGQKRISVTWAHSVNNVSGFNFITLKSKPSQQYVYVGY